MEIRQIELKGQIYEYQLNIKPIKRCYLKVKSGQIIVSCSPLFTIAEIEKLIKANADKLVKYLDNYQSKFNYCHNGYLYLFGQYYQIIVHDLNKNQVVVKDKQLIVYHHQVQKNVEKYLKAVLTKYITSRIDYWLKNSFNLKMPKIEIKKYKSRWGSCYPGQNKVSFNLALVHLDYELIDYVIVHELCHFIQDNHSAKFYLEVAKRIPDYQIIQRKLKEVGI